MTSPCDNLKGRLRQICEGTADIPDSKRRAYIDRWVFDGTLADDPDQDNEKTQHKFTATNKTIAKSLTINDIRQPDSSGAKGSCRHLGPQLRTEVCGTCGRKGTPAAVFGCSVHGECTLRQFNLKSKPTCCLTCSGYAPAEHVTRTWAVGITTAPRKVPTLQRTTESIQAAGWQPVLYAEPGTECPRCVPVVRRDSTMGPFRNWVRTAEQLLAADTSHVVIFQDDVLLCSDARQVIDTVEWPADAVLSLYTSSRYHRDGFHELPTENFWGACALVFPADILRRLLGTKTFREWSKPAGIDSAVGNGLHELGLRLTGWSPSLAQHIGETSTISDEPASGGRRANWRGDTMEVVIPAKDCLDLTERCLESIAAHADVPVRVWYVDNGSRPGALATVKDIGDRLGLDLRTIDNSESPGFAEATNRGILAGTGDVLMLNNDAFLTPGCLPAMRRHLWKDKVAAVGPLTEGNGHHAAEKYKSRSGAVDQRVLYGFCCLIRRDALRDVGLLDECREFPYGIGTDDEWCERARGKGWKLLVARDAYCEHLGSETFKRLGLSRTTQIQEMVRRRLDLKNKHHVGPRPNEIDVPAQTPTVLNLLYHICPFSDTDGWRHNIRQLLKRWNVFNGRKTIAVVTDAECAHPDDVKSLFPSDAEFIVQPNDKRLRESSTFPALMETVRTLDPRHATFYAHAKGVRSIGNSQGIVYWRNLMYRELLDEMDRTKDLLSKAPIIGTHRMVERPLYPGHLGTKDPWMTMGPWMHWHFAGTFFWFRNADVFSRNWKAAVGDHGWAIEGWPGLMFPYEYSRCVAHDRAWDVYQPHTYWPEERIEDEKSS